MRVGILGKALNEILFQWRLDFLCFYTIRKWRVCSKSIPEMIPFSHSIIDLAPNLKSEGSWMWNLSPLNTCFCWLSFLIVVTWSVQSDLWILVHDIQQHAKLLCCPSGLHQSQGRTSSPIMNYLQNQQLVFENEIGDWLETVSILPCSFFHHSPIHVYSTPLFFTCNSRLVFHSLSMDPNQKDLKHSKSKQEHF